MRGYYLRLFKSSVDLDAASYKLTDAVSVAMAKFLHKIVFLVYFIFKYHVLTGMATCSEIGRFCIHKIRIILNLVGLMTQRLQNLT